MKKLLGFVMMVLVLAACKKEPLPDLPEDTPPYYSIQGSIDGEAIDLNVGQEGIEIAQGTSMINGIPSYFGQIVSPAEELIIKFEFVRPELMLDATGVCAFDYSKLGFMVHEPGCRSFSFGNNQYQSNYLLIKDENGNFVPTDEVQMNEFGQYSAIMKFTDVGQNSFTVPVRYGFADFQLNPAFTLSPDNDMVHFEPVEDDGAHQWYVNDDLISSEESFSSTFPIGVHKVEHVIQDEYGNESRHLTLMRITDYVLDWKMDINVCGGSNTNNYGKVIVSVSKNGTLYTSDKYLDNLSQNFSVSNVEYIGSSDFNPERAVFDFFFNATLLNASQTDSLSLEDMTGTFNVGL
ncbi:MAG: hypothetical protein ABJG68_03780 [Crocinitomicaceae bacterium]